MADAGVVEYAGPVTPGRRPCRASILIGLALAGIVAIALSARVYSLGKQALFLDEFWNLELATGRGSLHLRLPSENLLTGVPRTTSLHGAPPWTAVWSNMDHVTHPPLYSLLLRGWIDVFGTSDMAARWLSVILSTAAILLLFDAVRVHHDDIAAALWAASIMAVAGAQVELAQEIRPYTLLLLLGLGAIDAIARIERFGTRPGRLAALALCALAMVLTHYFALAAIAGLITYAAWRLRSRDRIRVIAALSIACLLFALLWAPSMIAQSLSLADGDSWLRVDEEHHLLQTVRRLAILPMLMLFNPQRTASPIIYASSVVLIIPVLLLRRRPQLLLWIAWFWSTVAAIAAMEQLRTTRHLQFLRYTLLATPALYAMLAEIVPPAPPRMFAWLRQLVPGTVVLCCVLSLPAAYYPWKPDYRELAQFLDRAHETGAPVIFCSSAGSSTGGAEMYIGASHYARSYPWPFVMVETRPSDDLLAQLRKFPTVIVIAAPSGLMASDLFPGATVDRRQLVPYLATLERVRNAAPANPGAPP